MLRIGHGYDVHRLSKKRKLIIGGEEIQHCKGLDGHSDADVLIHAVMDSILGAMAVGDIGKLFPDTDNKYKGIQSIILLKEVVKLMKENNYELNNIDCTIIAQKPKLSPYTDKMRTNIAQAFSCSKEQISIKATTEEYLGFTGEELGIAAHCVCLINKD